jgi:pyruvate formate lyase activating enzyme
VRITDIQRFCLHDGPGIRTTVFFQGCPLRCVWCQNPECQTAERKLRFTPSRCLGCGACVAVCPQGAHVLGEGSHALKREQCAVCGRCAEVCPTGALGLVGEEWAASEIMDVVRRDRIFYDASGGGMTLSGGEPLAQAEGARTLLTQAKEDEIHTAVETCGAVSWGAIASVLDLVDLWLFDVKQLDAAAHRAATVSGNEEILDNLERLLAAGEEVIVRVPVIPGSNDGRWLGEDLPEWLRAHEAVREVHLMPYNRLAAAKYAGLGLTFALAELAPPSEAETEAVKAQIESAGVRVRVGG